MTIFGLNSPEIFIILVIFLFILGPKRIERFLNTFPLLIKFLLNDEKNFKLISEEKEVEEVKLEEKEVEEVKLEEKEVEEVKSEGKEVEEVKSEEKEVNAPNKEVKVIKTNKELPINQKVERKISSRRSAKSLKDEVKNKDQSIKKDKIQKKRVQSKNDIQTSKIKNPNEKK